MGILKLIVLRVKFLFVRLLSLFLNKGEKTQINDQIQEIKKDYDPTVYENGKPYTTTTTYYERKGTQPKGQRPAKMLIQKIQYYIWKRNYLGEHTIAYGQAKTIKHNIKGL